MLIEWNTMTDGINEVFRRARNTWEISVNSGTFHTFSSSDFIVLNTLFTMIVDVEGNTIGWKINTNLVYKIFSCRTTSWDRSN